METYSFSKLKKIKEIEKNFSKYSEIERTFGFFILPESIFDLMFDQYIIKSDKEFLSHIFYWDLEKKNIKNISDLFSIVDNSLYLCKSFDHYPINQINPIKAIYKNQCFSKDLITISFIDLTTDSLIKNFSFKRDSFLKLNLDNFISSMEEYFYNKKIKVSYKYKVSEESLTYIQNFKNNLKKFQRFEFNLFYKIKTNISFYLESNTDIKIPSNTIEEYEFLNWAELAMVNKNSYDENLLFLRKYRESGSIEYLMAINYEFESYKIKTPIIFYNFNHYIMEKIFKFFWKRNEK